MKNEEKNQIVIYETEDGQTQIDVRLDGETVWLTRQQLADLFNRNYKTISKHINNALKEELEGEEVVAKFANTTQHGAMEGKVKLMKLNISILRWFLPLVIALRARTQKDQFSVSHILNFCYL